MGEAGPALTLARLTTAATLEGEEVGVIAVAPQAEVGPADGLTPTQVQHQLALRQLHHPRAQLHPLVIHIGHLERRGQKAVSESNEGPSGCQGAVRCPAGAWGLEGLLQPSPQPP